MPITEKKDKEMLASLVEWYLEKHKEVDIKVFLEDKIDFSDVNPGLIREIANILRKDGKYEIKEGGVGSELTYFVKPISPVVKTWAERNPVWDKVRTGFITALFSLGVGVALFQIQNRGKAQLDTRQNKRLDSLSAAVDSLQKWRKAHGEFEVTIQDLPSDTTSLDP